ncbi:MAG: hypothetical protein ABJ201_08260, partial [Nisaea sp.]
MYTIVAISAADDDLCFNQARERSGTASSNVNEEYQKVHIWLRSSARCRKGPRFRPNMTYSR